MKIGIFGGSFDPPHMGHLWLCRNAIEQVMLDQLFIVPNKLSPFKIEKGESSHHILAMVELLAELLGSKASMTPIEVEREGKSYTVDTVKFFKDKHPKDELYLIMGGDSAMHFHTWHCSHNILDLVSAVVIAPRMGDLNAFQCYINKQLIIRPSFVQVSSTELRKRIKHRLPIDGLLPETIIKYIVRHDLYK